MLSGCVSGASSSTTVTVTESQSTAETSASEAATEGIFASQFDPCEEFSDEQLAAVGLVFRVEVPAMPQRIKACGFGHQEDSFSGSFLLATDPAGFDEIESQGLEPLQVKESIAGTIYIHKIPDNSRQCVASVDFNWGRFSVDYFETGEGWDQQALCEEPVEILDSLITVIRGK
ncbi:DUF3558 family protein [Corynebacterium callunae]|uniref:DUF3558 family protein n=1 Tax=Corynebacterium callunae TaxID=1721 RepID=UPI0024946099|nr:DUF3558 family protein [Corynebacterium callunae]